MLNNGLIFIIQNPQNSNEIPSIIEHYSEKKNNNKKSIDKISFMTKKTITLITNYFRFNTNPSLDCIIYPITFYLFNDIRLSTHLWSLITLITKENIIDIILCIETGHFIDIYHPWRPDVIISLLIYMDLCPEEQRRWDRI